jgi:hypothetical protein
MNGVQRFLGWLNALVERGLGLSAASRRAPSSYVPGCLRGT